MQNHSNGFKNKYYLMLCELHYPGRHGKTENSHPNIESHYIVYDRFEPFTGRAYSQLEDFIEYDSDSNDEFQDNRILRMNDEMEFLRTNYSNPANFNPQYFGYHPIIRNYHNIILKQNYIKPEIGEYIILPSQESIAILKTFWLRIIQKKWKKVFNERKNIMKQRCYLSNLLIREIRGKWPDSCLNLNGLKGMLSNLKSYSNHKEK
jgi:hypothetical protein